MHQKQGGGIATAFAANFPDLVTGKVVLIASTGLMEVRAPSRLLLASEMLNVMMHASRQTFPARAR